MILVEGAGVIREIVNRLGEEVGIMSSLTCLLLLLTLIMRVILIVRVMTRTRMGTVTMSGEHLAMLGQGFRGVQLFMNVMGLMEGLLEEEVLGMKPLYSWVEHLLSRLLLLSSWVGHFPTYRRTTFCLHSSRC